MHFSPEFTKPENVPESTFLLEQQILRKQGHGTIEITDDYRKQKTQEIIGNQEKSLDKWVDYLSSSDATYPMWAKYWAFNSMLKMGKFEKREDKETEKENAKFIRREKDTISSFPPLNPRALAMTISVITSKAKENSKNKNEKKDIENKSKKLNEIEFKNLLNTENFSKIYAQFLMEMPEYSIEGLRETRGKWVTYKQNSKPDELVKSLEGYPLEWCTANIDTARTQLQGGDFHVYYSINESGEAIIPRLAIRMQGNEIAENPRGIAPNQNLDPYIGDVLEKKLNNKDEFPNKEKYDKKSSDMKRLTRIEEEIQNGTFDTKEDKEELRNDLKFLYEMSSPIEGFGYQKDPRIEEIRKQRKIEEDAPIVFECQPEEFAYKKEDVNENTKAYIGPLFEGVFKKDFEYLYISFPEGKIQKYEVEIGGKTKEELKKEIKEKFKLYSNAESMMDNPDFTVSKNKEKIDTVRLKVSDLGFDSGNPTTDEIYERAEKLGLELCPAETGPHLRLEWIDQPLDDYLWIAMKQIGVSDRLPSVFRVLRLGDGEAWLLSDTARPTKEWYLGYEFLFRFRKSS